MINNEERREFTCIALDLDGTLLTTEKQIDPDTLDYLHVCIRRGIKVILVSGRHIDEILPYANQLKLRNQDLIISCDGEYINNVSGQTIWIGKQMCIDDAYEIQYNLGRQNMILVTPSNDFMIVPDKYVKWRRRIIALIKGQHQKIYSKICKSLNLDLIEKILITGKLSSDKIRKISDKYDCRRLEEGFLQILPKGVNKYNAISKLSSDGIIELNKTIYFGNDLNDLDCFQNMAYCVAMGNATKELKDIAFYITTPNDEKGVLKALRRYIKI